MTAHKTFSQEIKILDKHQWKDRILLVFAPSETATFEEQMAVIEKYESGFRERDLLVYKIIGSSINTPEGHVIQNEAQALRKKHQVGKDQFVVILIGKDGSSKLRQEKILEKEKLFDTIDAMPMRQQEMGSGDGG